jgi:hypothetical protein
MRLQRYTTSCSVIKRVRAKVKTPMFFMKIFWNESNTGFLKRAVIDVWRPVKDVASV